MYVFQIFAYKVSVSIEDGVAFGLCLSYKEEENIRRNKEDILGQIGHIAENVLILGYNKANIGFGGLGDNGILLGKTHIAVKADINIYLLSAVDYHIKILAAGLDAVVADIAFLGVGAIEAEMAVNRGFHDFLHVALALVYAYIVEHQHGVMDGGIGKIQLGLHLLNAAAFALLRHALVNKAGGSEILDIFFNGGSGGAVYLAHEGLVAYNLGAFKAEIEEYFFKVDGIAYAEANAYISQ